MSQFCLSLHGVTNTDINECEDGFSGGCIEICNNTIGSFECSCNTGFEFGSDGFQCLGKENNSHKIIISIKVCMISPLGRQTTS